MDKPTSPEAAPAAPLLMQDENSGRDGRRYNEWHASRPDARLNAREAAAAMEGDYPPLPDKDYLGDDACWGYDAQSLRDYVDADRKDRQLAACNFCLAQAAEAREAAQVAATPTTTPGNSVDTWGDTIKHLVSLNHDDFLAEAKRILNATPPAATPAAPSAGVSSHEHDIALREGHQIRASEGYFSARPKNFHTVYTVTAYEAGFKKGWDDRAALAQPAPVQAGAQQAVYQLRAPLSDDWKETPMTAAMREACDGFTRWYEVSKEVHDRCRDEGTHKHRVLYAARTQAGAGDAKGLKPADTPTPGVLNVLRVALDRADMAHRATGFKPFEVEAAKAWVSAAIAKATETAYQGVRCQCIVTGCRPGPGCPVYSKTHCEAHMAFVRSASATGSAALKGASPSEGDAA